MRLRSLLLCLGVALALGPGALPERTAALPPPVHITFPTACSGSGLDDGETSRLMVARFAGLGEPGCQRSIHATDRELVPAGASPGSIAGAVTEEGSGIPLPGACAVAFDARGQIQDIDIADGGGIYSLENLPPREYTIWFLPCHSDGFHTSEWYAEQSDTVDADPVLVNPGQALAAIDASLALGGGSISGTVLEEAVDVPLSNVCVLAFADPGGLVAMGITNGSGHYSLGGLASDSYSVAFIDCLAPVTHVTEWYNDRLDPDQADGVSAMSGQETSGVDASLAVGASMRGSVSEAGTKAPLSGICVEAFDAGDAFRGFAATDASGSYIVGGLPRGDYRVTFYDCDPPLFHITEWYDDESDFATATLVPVGGPRSVRNGVNASLAVGGSISGTVTAVDGRVPLSGICVDAYDTSFVGIGSSFTDASGAYEVGGLPAGDTKIWFRDCGSSPTYISKWYAGYSFDSAGPVRVAERRKSVRIDAELQPGSTINGTVTDDETHIPLRDVCVYLYFVTGTWIAFDRTDRSGTYAVAAHFGDHRILFIECARSPTHNPEWYDDKMDFDAANLIHAEGVRSKISGIDAELALGLAGDADCRLGVTSIDAALLLQVVAGLLQSVQCVHNADADRDGELSSIDAALILQFIADLIHSLPP